MSSNGNGHGTIAMWSPPLAAALRPSEVTCPRVQTRVQREIARDLKLLVCSARRRQRWQSRLDLRLVPWVPPATNGARVVFDEVEGEEKPSPAVEESVAEQPKKPASP